jgi:tRNA nucleotidyltransferase (CCA-adding enzyme)
MADPAADERAEIERRVLARITPDAGQVERIERLSRELVERAGSAARERKAPLVRALVAGSAARGTFLKDRSDIDLFLLFEPTVERARLEAEGLALAEAILPTSEMRYAEHPYRRGRVEGVFVDAVPGYAVSDPSHPLSAVDRTPFHHEYLAARITPPMVDQVRLAKQFLRGLGIYGSEARTAGFSGYLVELLVLRFGTLDAWLSDARAWTLPTNLASPNARLDRVPDDVALTLDDPVDPHRNVASALSRRNLVLFVLASQEYWLRPSEAFFEVRPPPAVPIARARARAKDRGTHVTVLTMPRPALVDDILYPQLRKAERALAEEAERLGFAPMGTAAAAGERGIVVLLEVGQGELPSVRVRPGPPPGPERSENFLRKWSPPNPALLQGPYVRADGRLAVETRRDERRLEPLLAQAFPQLPVGRDLSAVLARDGRLTVLAEADASPELELALADLFDKRLPWQRAA